MIIGKANFCRPFWQTACRPFNLRHGRKADYGSCDYLSGGASMQDMHYIEVRRILLIRWKVLMTMWKYLLMKRALKTKSCLPRRITCKAKNRTRFTAKQWCRKTAVNTLSKILRRIRLHSRKWTLFMTLITSVPIIRVMKLWAEFRLLKKCVSALSAAAAVLAVVHSAPFTAIRGVLSSQEA